MADQKQSQFPAVTPQLTDEVGFISDPAGTPANAKVDLATLKGLVGGGDVNTVNSKGGEDVILDPDDLDDAATINKFISAAEKSKLGDIEDNATADQSGAEIKSAYEGEADTNAFTDAEKTKLGDIEENATANSDDSALLDRANHTGTQTVSTISDFDTEVSSNADVAANTAKVSASGSIGTHSDVNLAGAAEGMVLVQRSGEYVPETPASGGGAVNTVNSKGGEDVVLDPDDLDDAATTNKFVSAAEKSKLGGIEDGATANSDDSDLLDRANHTGTQTVSTISDFDTEVSSNADVAANTAKVSASGSIGTHSDVNLAGAAEGMVLIQRSGEYVPETPASGGISEISEDITPQLGGELDAQSNKITNLLDPENDQDAATKGYVDSEITALTADGAPTTNIDGATLSGDVVSSVGLLNSNGGKCISVSPDGTKLFISGFKTGAFGMYEVPLPNPGRVLGMAASHDNYWAPNQAVNPPVGFCWSRSGHKVYITNGNVVEEWDASIPHSLSVAPTYSGNSITFNTIFSESSNYLGIAISSDGKKLYAMTFAGVGRKVFETTLLTPYDLSSNTGQNGTPFTTSVTSSDAVLSLSWDDKQLIFSDTGSDTIKEAIMSTPADLSTAVMTTNESASVASLGGFVAGIAHSPLGNKVIVYEQNTNKFSDLDAIAIPSAPFIYDAEELDNRTAKQIDVSDPTTINWDASTFAAEAVLTASVTLANPTNLKAGANYTLKVTQDGTGSHTLGYGSAFKFPAGTPPVITAAANSVDVIKFYCDGANLHMTSISQASS